MTTATTIREKAALRPKTKTEQLALNTAELLIDERLKAARHNQKECYFKFKALEAESLEARTQASKKWDDAAHDLMQATSARISLQESILENSPYTHKNLKTQFLKWFEIEPRHEKFVAEAILGFFSSVETLILKAQELLISSAPELEEAILKEVLARDEDQKAQKDFYAIEKPYREAMRDFEEAKNFVRSLEATIKMKDCDLDIPKLKEKYRKVFWGKESLESLLPEMMKGFKNE